MLTPSPGSLQSCAVLTVDEIAAGDTPQDADLWVRAGRRYAVPVHMDAPGVVLSWEFSTQPKVSQSRAAQGTGRIGQGPREFA